MSLDPTKRAALLEAMQSSKSAVAGPGVSEAPDMSYDRKRSTYKQRIQELTRKMRSTTDPAALDDLEAQIHQLFEEEKELGVGGTDEDDYFQDGGMSRG